LDDIQKHLVKLIRNDLENILINEQDFIGFLIQHKKLINHKRDKHSGSVRRLIKVYFIIRSLVSENKDIEFLISNQKEKFTGKLI